MKKIVIHHAVPIMSCVGVYIVSNTFDDPYRTITSLGMAGLAIFFVFHMFSKIDEYKNPEIEK